MATPYPHLPDPMLTNRREVVTSPEQWWDVRRPEIVEAFDREICGRISESMPSVSWEGAETTNGTNSGVAIVTKRLVGHVDNSTYPLISVDMAVTLATPASATAAVLVILRFGRPFLPRPSRSALHVPSSSAVGKTATNGSMPKACSSPVWALNPCIDSSVRKTWAPTFSRLSKSA
jgi:hypothetical protein